MSSPIHRSRRPRTPSTRALLASLALVGALSSPVAGAQSSPFLPPSPDAGQQREQSDPESSTQAVLRELYAREIAESIIRRSRVISILGNGRRLLLEPTMGCYLDQRGPGRLAENSCLQTIRERSIVHPDGELEYPVHAIPSDIGQSQFAAPAAILGDPSTRQFADSGCRVAYESMLATQARGEPIVHFNSATQANREGYRRATSEQC